MSRLSATEAHEPDVEFGSSGWFEAMRTALDAAFSLATLEEQMVPFSYSGTYLNVPAHLFDPDGVGYTARFDSGGMAFIDHPSQGVDVAITADYDAIRPRVRTIIADDPAAFWAREPLMRAGYLHIVAHAPMPLPWRRP